MVVTLYYYEWGAVGFICLYNKAVRYPIIHDSYMLKA